MIRVMIVDDEMLVRLGLRSGIAWQQYGCQVVGEACDGVEALELFRQVRPNLVFLDIGMPRMDGLAFFEEAQRIDPAAKFVILSCHNEFGLVKRALQLGAADYVHKLSFHPADVEALIARLKLSAPGPDQGDRQELCPPFSMQDAQSGSLDFGTDCVALTIRSGSGLENSVPRISMMRDVIGQVARYIGPACACFEESYCCVLLHALPDWLNGEKTAEIAQRLQEALSACFGGEEFFIGVSERCARPAQAIEAATRASPANRYVQTALRYVNSHFAQAVSLRDMSVRLNLNESYFGMLFKKEMGVSFVHYANGLRIRRAQALIRSGKTVTEAAYAVGFENVPYFTRLYKRLLGHAPTKGGDRRPVGYKRATSRDE